MATSLKRIEKEFVLSSIRDERQRMLLLAGNGEWPVEIRSLDSDFLVLSHAMPLRLLRKGQIYEFRFVYREQGMAFRAKTLEVKDSLITVEMPKAVYKNLGRRYSRRTPPPELGVTFAFKGERYELAFPTTREFTTISAPEASSDFEPKDIRALIRDFNAKAESYASERSIVMFKERLPQSIEERIIIRTGKILYLPSSAGGLPLSDPFVPPRIITREMFGDFLREEGSREDLVEEELARYERNLKASGTLSELLVPILFQEYVIGYVRLENRLPGKSPFDLAVLETFHLFAKILAYSLMINGYFKGAPKKPSDFRALVLDLSAGGILFANPSRELAIALVPDSRIDLIFKIGSRQFTAAGVVRRVYRDAERVYYGLEYDDMEPEDFRFLFESLYGRPFTDADALSIEGLGIKAPLF